MFINFNIDQGKILSSAEQERDRYEDGIPEEWLLDSLRICLLKPFVTFLKSFFELPEKSVKSLWVGYTVLTERVHKQF